MSGSFRCRRCGADVPVPEEARRDPTRVVVCPGCAQRYARRQPGGSGQPATGFTSQRRPGGAPRAESVPVASGATRSLGAPASSGGATFADGAFLANRYRVVRFIARGGMGEVYEVEDLELRCRVALKTVRAGAAEETGAVERLKREIQLARRVTHPNVCRIFDVGFHAETAAGSDAGSLVFLTMELLEGETLAARLRRAGRLSPAAALPIVRQMAAALSAAHGAGVVHRDFKSENVFLVPSADGERVVVTDFGIARGGDDAFGVTLTSTGNVIGTPAYMAPEQIEGGEITPAVDQYALGVVLFEMVTGDLPFRGDNVLQTAARRLSEAPPSPRDLVPQLDPLWERTILRCLGRRPGDRFRDVLAVARTLEGAPPSAEVPLSGAGTAESLVPAAPRDLTSPARDAPARSKDRRKLWLAVLLGVLLVAASISAWYRIRAIRERLVADAPVSGRRAVAVLAPRNLSGRAADGWLSTALAEMLDTEIGQGREVRVIPGESVERALDDLGLAEAATLDDEARMKLRRRLGAAYLVTGGYTALAGGAIRLDLRLEDARSTGTVATFAESGQVGKLFELVDRAGSDLLRALGARSAPPTRPALPTSPVAARAYAEGLEALRRFDPKRGRELLEEAVAADPDNALARSALATALGSLGYTARAEEQAQKARDLAVGLPPEERLVVEARYFEAARDWAQAAADWEKLWSAYPDDLDYGLRVAACRTGAGQADQALAAALALRNLPAPDDEDPRIDLAEASAAGALGDFRRQADAAAHAAARAGERGAKLLVAEAEVGRGWALRNLGRLPEARAAIEHATAIYQAAGDRAGAASADAALGGILYDLGMLPEAQDAYGRSLEASRQSGDRGGEARALNNLAVLERARGEVDAARESYEQVAAITAETGDRAGAAVAANNLASLLAELGELAAAADHADDAIAAASASGDKSVLAAALGNLGSVRRRQGDLAGAEDAWNRSLVLRRETGERLGEAGALSGLAQTLMEQGDLAGAASRFDDAVALARQLGAKSALATALAGKGAVAALGGDGASAERALREALTLRQQLGERTGSARAQVALARLELPGGATDAAALARELLAAAANEHSPEVQAEERELLARALLVGGDAAGAAEALASPGLAGRLGAAAGIDWALAGARVAAARGETLDARQAAAAAIASAAKAGLVGQELEAQLLAAELGGGDRADLAARARAAGFLELARRAAAPRPASRSGLP